MNQELCHHYLKAYDQSEVSLLDQLLRLGTFHKEMERAVTSTSIQIIEKARQIPAKFTLRQVFQRYPIQTAEGQTLFQLITQLCHISEKDAQQAFIQECFTIAPWMKEEKRRDQFFSATSSWGFSVAHRFFASLNNHQSSSKSLTHRVARKFGSPIMHKSIMQAINRLTNPLIFASSLEEALAKAKTRNGTLKLHLRPAFPYAITPSQAEDNFKGYLDFIQSMKSQMTTPASISIQHMPFQKSDNHPAEKVIQRRASLQIELHHFTGPIDIRQGLRIQQLKDWLLPLAAQALKAKITCIISTTQAYGVPVLRELLTFLIQSLSQEQAEHHAYTGLELSAAEPSSLDTLQDIISLAKKYKIRIPVRLTKEHTKPRIQSSNSIHIAYLTLTKLLLQHPQETLPFFVSHNAYTLAYIHHLADFFKHTDYEIHHRCGIGKRCQLAFQDVHAAENIRIEAPLGNKNHHHHMVLQRLREITDPHAFLNRLYDQDTTTAGLVANPFLKFDRQKLKLTDFWRDRKVRPHQPQLSIYTLPDNKLSPGSLQETVHRLQQKKPQSLTTIEARHSQLLLAHQNCVDLASLWVKLFVDYLDIPRYIAELHVEAALRQQARFLQKSLPQHSNTCQTFPRGQILWIGSGQRPLSPLLEQMTMALLHGNQFIIKPATATHGIIEQVIQAFSLSGFTPDTLDTMNIRHDDLQTLLKSSNTIDMVLFDGLQDHGKTLATHTIKNPKQPPIPFWATPAATCRSTHGICVVDDSASAQEVYCLVNEAWKLGPMVIVTTETMLPIIRNALVEWRESLIIGDADERDTQISHSQIIDPFPIELSPICKQHNINPPVTISAPQQPTPFFQLLEVNDSTLLLFLKTLSRDAKLNRLILLSRMPVRLKHIIESIPAHEIHLGWPKDHTSFVFRGLDSHIFSSQSHILRHHRLHPWNQNGLFDITDL